jgi:hypothetical protein
MVPPGEAAHFVFAAQMLLRRARGLNRDIAFVADLYTRQPRF